MKLIDALHTFEEYDGHGHTVWSLSDLRIVFPEKPAAFRKSIERLCAENILARVNRGVYVYLLTKRDARTVFGEVIAKLRQGEYCFESLESAACEWGIFPQTPLGGITVMTTGRSGRFATPFGPVEFVHTSAPTPEILANIVRRDDFIPIATREYTIHGLKRCGRTTQLNESMALDQLEG